MKKWLFALEQKAGKKGIKLTDGQVAALKGKKQNNATYTDFLPSHIVLWPVSHYKLAMALLRHAEKA